VRTSDNQLFCCKSIDKLITESEAPGQRLQKTLGPWSLTALGIGAIIGSGIFILTGTAAAGEYFQAPSILHAQALDVIINLLRTGSTAGALMHGRPPAGPSIAISFFLVAIACSFAGLCYAELASMIPIAGSAYTYSYATLGEIFAWIIGWDLILEYGISAAPVASTLSQNIQSAFSAGNIHLPLWLATARTSDTPHGAFDLLAFLAVLAPFAIGTVLGALAGAADPGTHLVPVTAQVVEELAHVSTIPLPTTSIRTLASMGGGLRLCWRTTIGAVSPAGSMVNNTSWPRNSVAITVPTPSRRSLSETGVATSCSGRSMSVAGPSAADFCTGKVC